MQRTCGLELLVQTEEETVGSGGRPAAETGGGKMTEDKKSKWKESIKKIVGLEIPDEVGLDV